MITDEKLDPYFISGFIDAEGCFYVRVTRNDELKLKWYAYPTFSITLHIKDEEILHKINSSFDGIGKISKSGTAVKYRITGVKHCKQLINHLEQYPLITQKYADYALFKEIVELIGRKEHLKLTGLRRIVSLKAALNKGLSSDLATEFSDITPENRLIVSELVKNPHWLAGFTDGDGHFGVSVYKSKQYKLGCNVGLEFKLVQHTRDEDLLKSFISYFECGAYSPRSTEESGVYSVRNFNDIESKIIPFFNKYPLHSNKAKDYQDFLKVAQIIKEKRHLTQSGLDEVLKIKSGMNTGRKEE